MSAQGRFDQKSKATNVSTQQDPREKELRLMQEESQAWNTQVKENTIIGRYYYHMVEPSLVMCEAIIIMIVDMRTHAQHNVVVVRL